MIFTGRTAQEKDVMKAESEYVAEKTMEPAKVWTGANPLGKSLTEASRPELEREIIEAPLLFPKADIAR